MMHRGGFRLAAAMAAIAAACTATREGGTGGGNGRTVEMRQSYPEARRADVVETLHGVAVADPWRWLEDPDSDETRRWVDAQNTLTESFLAASPVRERIRGRLTRLWDFDQQGVPFREGGRWFWFRRSGLQNQAVLYTADRLDGEPRVLLDPNTLSEDGTVSLTSAHVSPDGRLLAFGVSSGGSDWQEFRVRDVATGHDLGDRLRFIKFSGASFTADSRGFYYSRYPEPAPGRSLEEANFNQRLHFHRIGDSQEQDELILEDPAHREWFFAGRVTDDGRWLVVTVSRGTGPKNRVLIRDLTKPGAPIVPLVPEFEAEYDLIDSDGATLYFRSDLGAPRGRIIALDAAAPGAPRPREIVAESRHKLEAADLVGDRFFCTYLEDARSRVSVHDMNGAPIHDVDLPGIGTVTGFSGRREDRETCFLITGFTEPGSVWRFDVDARTRTPVFRPAVAFDASRFATRQVFVTSRDGTRFPMFLTHRTDLVRDGTNPVILYGYGGFSISLTPAFSPAVIAWLEGGGVYVQANLRGGGEYGEAWHEAGMLEKKENVFDDFIAAAEWLIAEKVTSPARLAISGRSNGGLLVGAAMTRRPDLFGAALPAVGVHDMLRFHRFTIGWAWVDDYGSPDDPAMFPVLLRYSPLHNVRPGTAYPATLVTTADHDDRVVPAHSYKFTAALQAAQAGSAPIFIRIDTRAGHGAGTPTTKLIAEATDRWTFLARVLDLPDDFFPAP